MQIAKEPQKSARGQLSLLTSHQCDTNCLCQKPLTTNRLKRQHLHRFLVERTGWNRQSSRLYCSYGISSKALIDTVFTIENPSDIRKRSPTLLSPPFNIIDRQKQHLGLVSSPRIHRRTYFSRRPIVLPSPHRKASAWLERLLVPERAGTTGKLRF